jgi:predicted nucleotidyltransferase
MIKEEQIRQKRIDEITTKIEAVLRKYPVRKAGLFGSVLTDKFDNEKSDVDLALEVDFSNDFTFFDYAGMSLDLEKKVGKKIDLMRIEAVKGELSQYILPNIKYFYDTNE